MFNLKVASNLIQRISLQKTLLRSISTTSNKNAMFNIQDEEDFKTRVMESAKPVIVDFHAQ